LLATIVLATIVLATIVLATIVLATIVLARRKYGAKLKFLKCWTDTDFDFYCNIWNIIGDEISHSNPYNYNTPQREKRRIQNKFN